MYMILLIMRGGGENSERVVREEAELARKTPILIHGRLYIEL
jgi:hypothetical protein